MEEWGALPASARRGECAPGACLPSSFKEPAQAAKSVLGLMLVDFVIKSANLFLSELTPEAYPQYESPPGVPSKVLLAYQWPVRPLLDATPRTL